MHIEAERVVLCLWSRGAIQVAILKSLTIRACAHTVYVCNDVRMQNRSTSIVYCTDIRAALQKDIKIIASQNWRAALSTRLTHFLYLIQSYFFLASNRLFRLVLATIRLFYAIFGFALSFCQAIEKLRICCELISSHDAYIGAICNKLIQKKSATFFNYKKNNWIKKTSLQSGIDDVSRKLLHYKVRKRHHTNTKTANVCSVRFMNNATSAKIK